MSIDKNTHFFGVIRYLLWEYMLKKFKNNNSNYKNAHRWVGKLYKNPFKRQIEAMKTVLKKISCAP